MTTKKKTTPKAMTMKTFQEISGPGESLEILRARQEEDTAWAARAFEGKEPLGLPIRIQRGHRWRR